MNRTLTWNTLEAATLPTFYFIGVTTGSSSIRGVFPLWAEHLGLAEREGAPVVLVGIDLPVHADPAHYRAVVDFIKTDPLSRGALVTTHKLDLFAAAHDLFDEIDPLAELMHEVSSLSKRGGRLRAHAKDPISSGLAIDAIVPSGHFAETAADAVVFGAGGSAIAIDWHLSRPDRGADRPARVIVTDRDARRLDALRRVHDEGSAHGLLETVLVTSSADNGRVLEAALPGSLVVNATGLGKDAPGSPLDDDALFPEGGIVWELNYRGDLVFADQAIRAQSIRHLRVENGWVYFIHGWTQVIAEVFDIEIPTSGPEFDALSAIAGSTRG